MTTGVYAGRFQPFGIHHRSVAEFIDRESDISEMVIVKGSSQWNDRNPDIYTPPARHPFTADECCEMIDLALAGRIKKSYRIVRVSDTKTMLTDPFWNEWVKAVVEAVGSKNFVLYVVDRKISRAFERIGIRCRPFPIDYPGLCATVIRKEIAYEPKEVWSKSLDSEVADYIEQINGPGRIRRLLEKT